MDTVLAPGTAPAHRSTQEQATPITAPMGAPRSGNGADETGAPPHPGVLLDAQFMRPRRITQQSLAKALHISRRRVNELIRGHRGVTADTALRLAGHFGNAPEYWMSLQVSWDLHRARMVLQKETGRE